MLKQLAQGSWQLARKHEGRKEEREKKEAKLFEEPPGRVSDLMGPVVVLGSFLEATANRRVVASLFAPSLSGGTRESNMYVARATSPAWG